MDGMEKTLTDAWARITKPEPDDRDRNGVPGARGSVAREFRRQAVAEAVVAAGQSLGRRFAERYPEQAGKAAWGSSAAGLAAGRLVRNDELNQAVHYFAAVISQTIRARHRT